MGSRTPDLRITSDWHASTMAATSEYMCLQIVANGSMGARGLRFAPHLAPCSRSIWCEKRPPISLFLYVGTALLASARRARRRKHRSPATSDRRLGDAPHQATRSGARCPCPQSAPGRRSRATPLRRQPDCRDEYRTSAATIASPAGAPIRRRLASPTSRRAYVTGTGARPESPPRPAAGSATRQPGRRARTRPRHRASGHRAAGCTSAGGRPRVAVTVVTDVRSPRDMTNRLY